jgi:hypothetical protein
MQFGPFEIEDAEYLEAYKRLDRAQKITADAVISIDASTPSAEISGSEGWPYSVTMERCNCSDFERRQQPCKHMYRLALELGHTFVFPQFDPYAAAAYDVSEDIERLNQRWQAGQLTFDAFVKCADALFASSAKSKHRPGRPRKNE